MPRGLELDSTTGSRVICFYKGKLFFEARKIEKTSEKGDIYPPWLANAFTTIVTQRLGNAYTTICNSVLG